jgi:hypothetical protein
MKARDNGSNPRFRVGDWVSWVAGDSKHLAVVIEDRGPIGVQHRRHYRLREYPLWTDPVEYGMSEDHLQPAERPDTLPEPHNAIPVP